eukprot:gene4903-3515_t
MRKGRDMISRVAIVYTRRKKEKEKYQAGKIRNFFAAAVPHHIILISRVSHTNRMHLLLVPIQPNCFPLVEQQCPV